MKFVRDTLLIQPKGAAFNLVLRVEENFGILTVLVANISLYSSCANFVKTEALQIHFSCISQEFTLENSVDLLLLNFLLDSNILCDSALDTTRILNQGFRMSSMLFGRHDIWMHKEVMNSSCMSGSLVFVSHA